MTIDAARAAAQAAFDAGDFAATMAHANDVLRQRGDDPFALVLFANAALALARFDEAIVALERLVALQPAHPPVVAALARAHHARGARAQRDGDATRAQAHYDRALVLSPDHADALMGRARVALDARHPAVALPDLARLRSLRPADADVALLHAETALACGDVHALPMIRGRLATPTRDATARVRLALALADGDDSAGALAEITALRDPRDIAAATAVAQRLADNGDADAARHAYAHLADLAGDRAPGIALRIAAACALPSVYTDAAHLARERAAIHAGIDEVTRTIDATALAAAQPALEQLQWSHYLLAYQGGDDRDALSRYGDWLADAAARFAPSLATPPAERAGAPPRVGLLSSAFTHSSVGAYFGSWIGALRDAGFDTTLCQLGATDNVTDALARDASALLRLDGPLATIGATLRAQSFDLLLMPDLGVDPRLVVLAALPLARRRVMAWGLPTTSGIPGIAAMFTCDAMEPPGADAHYREPLLRLPGLGTRYRRPTLPPPATRDALGLPHGRLYLVPQIPAKIHPAFDAVIARIARQDRDATIVAFAGSAPGATRRLHARFDAPLRDAGVDPAGRVVLLAPGRRSRFLQVCMACDVMVDTHHWSGGNTTIDALLAGLPVVAWPGARMRGRQSAAMLGVLGLADDLVATDGDAQADRAVAIARDPTHRARLAAAIAQRLPTLLDDDAPLRAFVAHVRDMLATP